MGGAPDHTYLCPWTPISAKKGLCSTEFSPIIFWLSSHNEQILSLLGVLAERAMRVYNVYFIINFLVAVPNLSRFSNTCLQESVRYKPVWVKNTNYRDETTRNELQFTSLLRSR